MIGYLVRIFQKKIHPGLYRILLKMHLYKVEEHQKFALWRYFSTPNYFDIAATGPDHFP
jgi:hypothetical protein